MTDWMANWVLKRAWQLLVLYPRDILLDITCGEGELLRRIAADEPKVSCAGICATPQFARTARHRAPQADIMYAEPDDFPWLNHSFDVALCLFPAMTDLETLLPEAYRVLKPGGQFIFAAPWMPEPLRALANRLFADDREDAEPILSVKRLVQLLERAGFEQADHAFSAGLRRFFVCWKS